MAREEKKHEEKKKEHHRRARGGMVGKDKSKPLMFGKEEDMPKRKHGGMVHGEKAMKRPDRRARGGATSDADPYTSAGKMSKPDYENKQAPETDSGGKGADRD